MKKIIQASLILLFIINAASCKKETTTDNDTPDIKIYGLWQIIQSDNPNALFINFRTTNNLTIYSQNSLSFKSVINTVFSPSVSGVIADFTENGFTVAYNYQLNGDTLLVTGNNNTTVLKGVKSTSTAPDTWVTTVTAGNHIDNLFTDNSQGIGFDGTNLLFCDYNNGKIVKVDIASGTIAGNINTVTSLNTIESAGANYWAGVNGYQYIRRLDATGAVTFTGTAAMGAWLYGIGYVSPTSIICYSNNERTIYNYNPSTDIVTSSVAIDGVYLRDIAIANGKVYITSHNSIFRLNASTFVAEKTYMVDGVNTITGIAYTTGNSFWLNTENGAKIVKVDLN